MFVAAVGVDRSLHGSAFLCAWKSCEPQANNVKNKAVTSWILNALLAVPCSAGKYIACNEHGCVMENMVKFASKLQKKKCYKGSKTNDASAMPERGLADYPLIQVCKQGTCHIVTRRLVSKVSKTSTFISQHLLKATAFEDGGNNKQWTCTSSLLCTKGEVKSKHLTTCANVHMLLWNAMCMAIAANNTGGVYMLASISVSLPEDLILP